MVEVKILSVIVAFMVMAKLTVIIVVVNMNYSIGAYDCCCFSLLIVKDVWSVKSKKMCSNKD